MLVDIRAVRVLEMGWHDAMRKTFTGVSLQHASSLRGQAHGSTLIQVAVKLGAIVWCLLSGDDVIDAVVVVVVRFDHTDIPVVLDDCLGCDAPPTISYRESGCTTRV